MAIDVDPPPKRPEPDWRAGWRAAYAELRVCDAVEDLRTAVQAMRDELARGRR
jgi:hypothetical protein